MRIWSNQNSGSSLGNSVNGTIILENYLTVSKDVKTITTYGLSIPVLSVYPRERKKNVSIRRHAPACTRSNKCTSTEEWIQFHILNGIKE